MHQGFNMQHSVNEDSTAHLNVIFYDEKDNPTTPSSVDYTISDYETDEVLVEKSITPESIITITLPPSVNKIIDDDNDIRIVRITAKYGEEDQHVERFMYQVDSLR